MYIICIIGICKIPKSDIYIIYMCVCNILVGNISNMLELNMTS